jgi:hypothetical protein
VTITSASLRAFVAAILHASIDAFTAVVATSRLVRSLKIELLLLLSPFLWVLDDVSCDVAHAAF